MKNILFISIAFPPKSDPECIQTAKYFKYLAKNDSFSISVITSRIPTLFMPVDPQLSKYIAGFTGEIIKIPIYENKYFTFLVRRLGFGLLDKPDSKFTFYWQWKKALNQLSVKPDIIYSRSFPLSSALMALKIKKKINKPWIMHLSDPWADSPLHQYSSELFEWHNKMESVCMLNADIISLTSEKALVFYQEKYSSLKHKFKILPNLYDEDDVDTTEWQFGDKLKIVYTGGLISDRSPEALFAAIDLLLAKDPLCFSKVEFVFAGQMDRKNKRVFEKNVYPFVKHVGAISYSSALELQKTASMLLLIDNPIVNPKYAMFFPSKLLDYMTAKKRILAITSPKSSTFNVLQNSMADCIAHADIRSISNSIMDAIHAFEDKNYSYFKSEDLDKNYSAAYNAKKLEKIINSL